jgi:hypothetical protein
MALSLTIQPRQQNLSVASGSGLTQTIISVGLVPVGVDLRESLMFHTPASLSRGWKSFCNRLRSSNTAVPRSLAGRERKYLAFLPDKRAGEQESEEPMI